MNKKKLGRPKGARFHVQRMTRIDGETNERLEQMTAIYKTTPSEFIRWLIEDAVSGRYTPERVKLTF